MKVSTRTSTPTGSMIALPLTTSTPKNNFQQFEEGPMPSFSMQLKEQKEPNHFTINQNLRGMQTFTKTESIVRKTTNRFSRFMIAFAVILSFFTATVNAQTAGTYSFANGTSPFNLLSGSTAVAATNASNDDGISAAINIGFTFNFGGTNFTQFKMNTNGWMALGSVATSTTNYSSLGGTETNVIAAYSQDLTSGGSAMSYLLTGIPGSQILKIEWKNTTAFSSTTLPDLSNWQIWLYEGTNKIEIRYGSFALGTRTSSASPQVGLHGVSTATTEIVALSGAWNGPTAGNSSSSTMTMSTSSLPDNGRMYTFAPPPPCATPVAQAQGPLVLTAVPGSTTSVTGTFTASFPSSNGYLVVRTPSSTPPTPPSNGVVYAPGNTLGSGTVIQLSTATSFTATGLTASTHYWFWVYSSNEPCVGSASYFSSFPLSNDVTTNAPAVPICPTSYTPSTGSSNVPTNQTFSWSGALGDPAITGYDVYMGTNFTAVNSLSPATKVVNNGSGTTFTPSALTILLAPGTQYFWKVVPINSIGTGNCGNPQSFTTYIPVNKTSTAKGGLWNDAATWIPSGIPVAGDNVTIADGAVVTINTAVTVSSLTIGQGGVGTKSYLQWSTSNTLTAIGNITIASNGNFLPYTASSPAGQTIIVGGNFTNNGYANLAVSGTNLNFNGSQIGGGSASQVLGGTGTFEGDGTNGIIRSLLFQTSGSSSITTTQNLITSGFTHTAGSLNTNGKLTIDNTSQVYGSAISSKISSVTVTGMGAGYAAVPVVGPASSTLFVATQSVVLGAIRVFGTNVYVVTVAGTTGAAGPNHGSGTATNGTATFLWVGNTGTIGNAIFGTGSLTPTAGTQYFYGTRLFTCTTSGAITGAQAAAAFPALAAAVPGTGASSIVVVGSSTFICTGSAAQVTVNHDAGTSTVRSMNLTDPGSGYTNATAPTMVFLGTNTSVATGIATFFQQIAGPTNSTAVKMVNAAISGGLTIKSDQAVGSLTSNAITTTDGGAGYTAAPTVGFTVPTGYLNLVNLAGSGYTTGATAAVSGGTIINGGTTPTFTVGVAQGKVVSVVVATTGTALYTVLPNIVITPASGGSGATASFPAGSLPTATAVLTNGVVTNFNITAPGFGYAAAPTVGYGTGVGTTAGTLVAGGRAAAAPSCRLGLYNLTYNFFTPPGTTNIEGLTGAEVTGAGNRVNAITMGSTAAGSNFAKVKLSADLELYAGSSALVFQTGTSYGSVLNLNGKTLSFSNPVYTGTGTPGSATNAAYGYATNGFMKMNLLGSISTQTRTFPFDAPIAVTTGSGATAALGATVTSLTVTQTGKPSGAVAKFPVGNRAYNVVTNAGAVYGTNPTVQLTYILNDSLPGTLQQQYLSTGQSASLTGPWTTRSALSVSTAILAVPVSSITTATTGNGPIVPTGNDYYSFLSEAPIPVVSVASGPYCSAGGQTVAITGTGFTNVSSVKFGNLNAASYVVNSVTSITAVTPSGIATGVVTVTANGVTGSSASYTVNANIPPEFVPVISNNGLICTAGGSVSITLNDIGASSYTWTGGTGTDLVVNAGGLSVVASPTTTTEYTVTAANAGGCTITRKFQVGYIPGSPLVPTASQTNVCFNPGATVTLDSHLTAGNFSVASTTFETFTAPPTATFIVGSPTAGTTNPQFVLGGTSTWDDGGVQNVPIGFNYNFFGSVFNSLAVGSNGMLMFGPVPNYTASPNGSLGQYSFTSTNGIVFPNYANPGPVIALLAADLDFRTNGSIKFWNDGVAPTRRFIIQYNAPYFSSQQLSLVTAVLYETTGIVEIHVASSTYDGSHSRTIGLQDASKTIGAAAPGRQAFTTAITTPEAWRFSPGVKYQYSWSPSDNLDRTDTSTATYTITPLTTIGTKNINLIVTNPLTGCQTSAPISFTINTTPTAPVVSGITSVCGSGFTALTTNQPASGNSIKWYNDPLAGILVNTGTLYVTPVITHDTTFYVAEESNTCASLRTAVTIHVTAPPTFTVNKPVVCSNVTSVQLNVTSPTAPYDTYIWSPLTNLFEDAALTIPYLGRSLDHVYVGGLTPGISKYIGKASSFTTLCAATDTAVITVLPNSKPVISSLPAFICKSGSAVLSLNATSALASGFVQWQSSPTNSGFTDIVAATDTTYNTGTVTTGTWYQAIIKNDLGQICWTTDPFFLAVNNPQVTSAPDQVRCGAGALTLTATAPSGSFNWYDAANGGSNVQSNSATYLINNITTTTPYWVGLTVNGCEGTRTQVNAIVTSPATVSLTSNQTVCNSAIATINITSTLANYNHNTWTTSLPAASLFTDPGATTSPYVPGSDATTIYARTPSAAGGTVTFTVSSNNSVSGCSTTATTQVTYLPQTITASQSPASICAGGSTTISLNPSSGYGAGTIQWQSSATGLGGSYTDSTGQDGTSITTKALIQDRYYQAIIKDGTGNQCSIVQYTVTVNNPQVATVSSPNTRCGTGPISLTATAPTGTIKWYANPTGGIALATGTVSVTYSPSVSADITYYVSLTIGGCEGSRLAVPVTVSTPGPISVSSATHTQGCGAGAFQIDAIGTYDQYIWSPIAHLYFDAAGSNPYDGVTTAQTVYFISSTAGVNDYTVTGSNLSSPFCANTATAQVTVTASLPITVAIANQTVCNDAVATLSVSSNPTDYDNYIWTATAPGTLFMDNLGTVPYDGVTSMTTIWARTTTPGSITYTVSGSYIIPSCIGTATAKVFVQPATGTITSNTAAICNSGSGGSATLTLTTSVTLTGGIQWQRSLDGSTGWANVPSGGTSATYNTGSITNSWYYQVVLSPTTGGPCTAIGPFFQLVNSPAVSNPVGGSRCGAGQVLLSATLASGTQLNWYTAASGGSIQSNALTYSATVPSTAGTYPFYVSANIGTCFSSPRTVVNAVVSSAPTLVVNSGTATVVCNNAYAPLAVTSNTSDYDSYIWTPVTPVNNLYTNQTGTAYVPGSSTFSTVYAKTATQGSTTYTVTASNSSTSCSTTATAVITVQPASASASSAPIAPICVSGTVTLTLTPSTGFAAGTLHWMSSATGVPGSFTDIGTSTTPLSIPNVTSSTFYHAEIRNSAGAACITTTPDNIVTVNNPQVTSPTGNTRCGTGTVALTATSGTGLFNWYTTLTGGTSIGTGVTTGGTLNTFTTPVISATKTYYVGLTVNGCEGTRLPVVATVTTPPSLTVSPVATTICNGTITQIDVNPTDIPNFSSYNWAPSTDLYTDAGATLPYDPNTNTTATTVYVKRTQPGVISYFLTGSNAGPGGCVNQDTAVITVLPAVPVISGTPSSICTSGTSVLSLSSDPTFPPVGSVQWQSSLTNSGFTDIGGATSGTYTTLPITATTWYNVVIKDGLGNVCPTIGSPFQLVYNNPVLTVPSLNVSRCGNGTIDLVASASPGSTVNWYTNPIGGLPFLTGTDGASSTFTTAFLTSTTIYYVSANVIGSTTCKSDRIAITATVSTPPVLTATAPQTVCNGAVATLEIISDQSQYQSYIWTGPNLYRDPAATTTPYDGLSATKLYTKSTVAGTYSYSIAAAKIPASCTASTTTTVSVQLGSATISSNPVALCVNGVATLSLSPDQPYGVGSIQWERSILGDGSDWIGSPGAVGVTYTTPLQAATRYYHALIKDGTGAVCFATNTYQLVATSPQILTTTGDTRCGTQTATLSATATVGSVMRWYATAAGGTPLAIGGTFVTPVLSATTTYYVQASLGTCLSGMVPVVATFTPAPAMSVTPSANVCANTVGTLTASSAGLNQFTWSPVTNLFTDALGTVPYVAGAFASTVYVKSNTAGATTYTITGSSSVGNCVNVATTTVTIIKVTINSVVASPTSVCVGNTSVLTATGAGTYNYTWNPGSVSGNPVTVNPPLIGINTYTVTATDPASGCTTTGTVNVTAIAGPVAPVTAPSTQCGYGIPSAFAVGTTNGNFRWYLAPTGGTALVGETNSSLISYAISTTTVFYVSIYNGSCESLRTPVTATVNQPDAITTSVNNNSVCLNSTITLTATKAVGPSNYGYTWTASPAAGSGIPTTATGPVVTITPTLPGTYVYTVTAFDGTVNPSCTQISSVSATVKPLPVISQASATPGAICAGTNSVLNAVTVATAAGTATVGAGTTTTSTYNAPFYSLWSNKHMQILFTASELTASGLFAGNITSLGFPTTSGTVANVDYSIKMANTNVSNVASFVTSGLTQVYSAPSVPQVANTNNVINLTTPFVWDGTSNLIVELCFGDNTTTATLSSTSPADATSYISVITTHQTVNTAGATICPDATTNIVSYAVRPKVLFGGQIGGLGAGTYNWSWNPGALSGNTQTVSPPGTTVYTVTATDPATNCSISQPVTVTVNQLPAAPQAIASSQCGTIVPTAVVISQSGLPSPIFKWYLVPTGGTAVQTGPSDTYLSLVSATTTFYVSEVSAFGCESARVPVQVDVSDADVITAVSTPGTHCPNFDVTLTATQTVVNNSYSYTWTASPEAGSGITGSVDGGSGDVSTITVTPTSAGTYTYTVTGFDLFGGCTNVATVTVTVAAPPLITSVLATPPSACSGAPVVLSALSVPSVLGSATIGDVNSAVSNGSTGYPSPYANYYWGDKTQILITAAEMTAAGFVPGNLTHIAFDVTALNSVPALVNYTLRIGTTTATALSTFQTTGLTTVFSAPLYTPVLGINDHTFSSPFFWDGTSNIIVDVCMNDGAFVSNGNASVRSTATANNSVLEYHADASTVCASPGAPNILTARPNVMFTGQVGANVTSTLTWLWTPGNLTGSTVTVNPTSNISYTVKATNTTTGCYSVSAPVSITVNPIPAAPTVTLPPSPQCGFAVPTATVSGSGGVFKWYSAATGGTLLQTGGSSYATAISTTTTFYVSETSAFGCEGPRAAVLVTVTQPDAINAGANLLSVCPNTSIQLAVSDVAVNPINNYTYTWSATPASGSGMPAPVLGANQTVVPSVASAYTYKVIAFDAALGCTNIANVNVTVNPKPVFDSIRASQSTICLGGSSVLKAYSGVIGSGPQTAPTYCVDDNSGGSGAEYISSVTFNTLNNVTGAPAAPYTVTYPYSGSTTTTVSAGQTYTLSMTSALGSIASVWIDYNRNGVYEASEWQQVWTSATSGSISITIPSNAVSGATGMRIRTRGAGNTNGSGDACTAFFSGSGQDYTINVLSVITQNPAFNYVWTPGPLSGSTVTVNPIATTNYTVVATNPLTGCASATGNISVTVAPLSATASATPSVSCSGSPVILNANPVGGAPFTYIWSIGSTVIGNTQSITVNPTVNTTYTVTVSDACNNITTATTTVTINPLPTASISQVGPISICSPATQTLNAVTNAASPAYQWSLEGTPISGATSATYTVSGLTSNGNYSVRITDGNTTCSSVQSASVSVSINPLPSAVTVSPATPAAVCAGTPIMLTATGGTLPGNVALGTGTVQNSTTSTTDMPPYGNWYTGNRHQILVRASELTAQGLIAGSSISSLAFDVVSNTNALGYTGFTIKLGHTNALALSTTFLTDPTTQVYFSANYNPVTGLNTHTFSSPFIWDGTSNIVVETYFSNCGMNASSSCSGTTCTGAGSGVTYTNNAVVNQTVTDYPSHAIYYSDAAACNIQTQTTALSLVSERPNMIFVATLPTSITWAPQAGLYTDAAATVPYTGGPASVVYAKPVAGTYLYTATATSSNGCANVSSGTSTVIAKPIPVTPTVTAVNNGNGTSTLTASNYTGSLLWSTSATTPSIVVSTIGTYTVTQTINGCTSPAGSILSTPNITADPAVGQMDITDLGDLSQDANTLAFGPVYKLKLPVYNFEQDFVVPAGATTLKVDLGTKMTINPGFNLGTVLPGYYTWTVATVAGHQILTGDQIADLPGDFDMTASFDVIGTLSCTSKITSTMIVDNHASTVQLIDLVLNNNQSILQYNLPVTVSATSTNVSCFGLGDGTITVTASPGTTVVITNALNAVVTAPFGPGTYTITASAAGDNPPGNTCSATTTVTITEPILVTISATHTNVSCFGDANGTITATASLGATITVNGNPYNPLALYGPGTYTVVATAPNGNNDGFCTATQTVIITEPILVTISATASNVLCFGAGNGTITASASLGATITVNGNPYNPLATYGPGTYTIVATAPNGNNDGFCTATTTVSITQPSLVTATITAQTNVLCNGLSTGSATVLASGGTPGYTYLWSDGQTTAIATGLAAGTYGVTVKDANNCAASTTVTITQPTALSASIVAQNNVLGCHGDHTGAATVLVTGGVGPYSYSWNTVPVQTFAIATNLGAGSYIVTVTDANNCSTTATVTITEPTAVVATITGQTNVSCNGFNNGSATVAGSGGTPGYTYLWSNGQTGATATGLIAGTYNVVVTDTHNCTANTSVTITEPVVLTAVASVVSNVSCNGANNGSATVTPGGGTAPYTYLWSDGQTTQTATGLSPIAYTVTVTDAHGCVTTSNSVTITEPAILTATATATNVSCFGNANGTATVVVTGGTAGFTYLWNDGAAQTTATATGLAPGTYDVTVTDSHGCVALSNTVTITQPILVTVSGVPTNVSCFGASNGLIAVTHSAGATVVITNASNTDVTALNGSYGPGTYTLTATAPDGNGAGTCSTSTTVTITEPILVTVSGVANNVSCNAAANGSITVTHSVGATVVITNSLNVDVTAQNGSYGPGTYTLTASAPNGNNDGFCTASTTVTITEPAVLTISTGAVVNNTCHGGSTGSITVTAAGGTTAYAYTIAGPTVNTTGATSGVFTGLSGGSYTITVTDAHGCTASTLPVTVTQPAGLFPDISLGGDFTNNFLTTVGEVTTVVYNVAEIAGNPSVGDTIRITKVAGYSFSFNPSQTLNPVGPNTLDNARWKIDNSNPAFVSLIFDPLHNSSPGMLNCGERVFVSIDMTRNTPNQSTFTLSARLRKSNGEVNLANNLKSFVFTAE